MNGCIYRAEENRCEFWSDNGAGIVSYCDFEGCVDKHPSNSDRIRTMTDEELADKFEEVQLNTVKAYSNDDMLLAGDLRKYWLDWLKREAE